MNKCKILLVAIGLMAMLSSPVGGIEPLRKMGLKLLLKQYEVARSQGKLEWMLFTTREMQAEEPDSPLPDFLLGELYGADTYKFDAQKAKDRLNAFIGKAGTDPGFIDRRKQALVYLKDLDEGKKLKAMKTANGLAEGFGPDRPNMVRFQNNRWDFWIDKYEVTQEDFEKVMGSNPSSFKGCKKCPVESVTWHEAMEYCKKVGKTLPEEFQWEYAAMSGVRYVVYATADWEITCSNASWGRHPLFRKCPGFPGPDAVGSYAPNPAGLYDMSGNVWEWTSSDVLVPMGLGKVIRGGSWKDVSPEWLSVIGSGMVKRDYRNSFLGFRCSQ